MWINANERKPDSARNVFVRGQRRENEEVAAVASWHDFDNRWSNFISIDNANTAIGIKVTHWMEITDILSLPVEKKEEPTFEEHSKWYVPAETIKRLKEIGYSVKFTENWGYSPITPRGFSITRGPCRSEMEAWYYCRLATID